MPNVGEAMASTRYWVVQSPILQIYGVSVQNDAQKLNASGCTMEDYPEGGQCLPGSLYALPKKVKKQKPEKQQEMWKRRWKTCVIEPEN